MQQSRPLASRSSDLRSRDRVADRVSLSLPSNRPDLSSFDELEEFGSQEEAQVTLGHLFASQQAEVKDNSCLAVARRSVTRPKMYFLKWIPMRTPHSHTRADRLDREAAFQAQVYPLLQNRYILPVSQLFSIPSLGQVYLLQPLTQCNLRHMVPQLNQVHPSFLLPGVATVVKGRIANGLQYLHEEARIAAASPAGRVDQRSGRKGKGMRRERQTRLSCEGEDTQTLATGKSTR